MNTMLVLAVYIIALYYFTMPGVLITLPSATSSMTQQRLVHGAVFAAVFLGTYKEVLRFTSSM